MELQACQVVASDVALDIYIIIYNIYYLNINPKFHVQCINVIGEADSIERLNFIKREVPIIINNIHA